MRHSNEPTTPLQHTRRGQLDKAVRCYQTTPGILWSALKNSLVRTAVLAFLSLRTGNKITLFHKGGVLSPATVIAKTGKSDEPGQLGTTQIRWAYYRSIVRKTDVSNSLFSLGNFDLLASSGREIVEPLDEFPRKSSEVVYGRAKTGFHNNR